jgi:hypothetical protein
MDAIDAGSLEMRYLNGPTCDIVDTGLACETAGGTILYPAKRPAHAALILRATFEQCAQGMKRCLA